MVRRAETDAGQRPGLTSDERGRLRELEREVKELRRANAELHRRLIPQRASPHQLIGKLPSEDGPELGDFSDSSQPIEPGHPPVRRR